MTYVVTKIIKGNPYLYEVRSERDGDRVRQVFVRYLGRAGSAKAEARAAEIGMEEAPVARRRRPPKLVPVSTTEAVEQPIETIPELTVKVEAIPTDLTPAPEPVTPKAEAKNPYAPIEKNIPNIGNVDASIADELQSLNEAGFKTIASHSGLIKDHPENPKYPYSGLPTGRDSGYISFIKKANTPEQIEAIRRVAKEAGLAVEDGETYFTPSVTVRTTILKNGKTLADLTAEANKISGLTKTIGTADFLKILPERDRIERELIKQSGGYVLDTDEKAKSAFSKFAELLTQVVAPSVEPKEEAITTPVETEVKPEPQITPITPEVTPPSEPKELKLSSSYDAFKTHNAPTYDYVDKWGNDRIGWSSEAYSADYMTKSSDTGRNLRWVYVLNDGREVSLESYLKIKHPEMAGQVSSGKIGFLKVWHKLANDERQTIVDSMPWNDILPQGKFTIGQHANALKSVEQWLIDNKHPLAPIVANDAHINYKVDNILKNQPEQAEKKETYTTTLPSGLEVITPEDTARQLAVAQRKIEAESKEESLKYWREKLEQQTATITRWREQLKSQGKSEEQISRVIPEGSEVPKDMPEDIRTLLLKPEPTIREIPYNRDLDIRNIESLPRGTGAKYLIVLEGQGDELIAKQWARVKPASLKPDEVLVSMTPTVAEKP